MKKPKPHKPRDPFVQHLVKKKQGAHGRTYKQNRNKEKVVVKQQLSE